MKNSRFRIAALSRDPSFLLRTVLWILLPGIAVAFGVSCLRPDKSAPDGIPGMGRARHRDLTPVTSRSECVRLLDDVRAKRANLADTISEPNPKHKEMQDMMFDPELARSGERFLKPEEVGLLMKYRVISGFMRRPETEDLEPFKEASVKDPVSGLILSMYGDMLWSTGEYDTALAAYERGATDEETGADCRRRALELCRRRGWTEKLRRLYVLPGWREAALETSNEADRNSDEIAASAGDWLGLMRIAWSYVEANLRHPRWIVVSVMCGLLWFLIIHLGACVPVKQWWRGLLGVVLGVLSIPLTLFLITVEKTLFGIHAEFGKEDVFYCVSGIGLREELAKLLLFVPLLPLLRKAQASHVLAAAACVGLGFAVEENINYFAHNEDVWGRFVMANFLHFGLTGLTGLALWQAVRNSRWLSHFVGVFAGAVVFHGLWDFTPADPRLTGDYHYFMFAGLAGLSLYFFRELGRYSQPVPGVPSALLVFLAGGALLLTVILSLSAWDLGFRLALVTTFQPVLALFVIGAAMYYQLRRV